MNSEFQTDYDYEHGDTLFDAFHIGFYEEIQGTIEYRTEHARIEAEQLFNPNKNNICYDILSCHLSSDQAYILVIPKLDLSNKKEKQNPHLINKSSYPHRNT